MFNSRQYYVYILTNKNHTVLYTGVTGNIFERTKQHKEKHKPGFTKRYNVNQLIYFESYSNVNDALAREKQIKRGSRKKKIDLINAFNPEWKDFSDEVFVL